MIGLLRGRLIGKHPPSLLLDVGGVGYEVEAPMTTFYDLPAVGVELTLYTHLVVREDAHTLYGFTRVSERALFRNLIRVNGVGAKLALAILSGMDANSFARCIHDADAAALTRLPGIGKKTAERLIVEMRDRLEAREAGPGIAAATGAGPDAHTGSNPVEEAVSALIGLGYKPHEASRMVRNIDTVDLSCEEIIRGALQATVHT
jgi:Holliday junction DNA helicase RuvA